MSLGYLVNTPLDLLMFRVFNRAVAFCRSNPELRSILTHYSLSLSNFPRRPLESMVNYVLAPRSNVFHLNAFNSAGKFEKS